MDKNTIFDRILYKINLLKMNGFSESTIARVLGISEDIIRELAIIDADYEVITES